MENRQILDLKALEAFKNNLFEKRVGGLRTEHVVSPSDAYKVTWDASEVRLGRMRGDSSSDPYATLYVDHVVSRRLELKGDDASAALSYINTVDVYASGDVYIKGSSVSYRLAQAEKRLDQLGFKKGTAAYTRNGSALLGTTSGIPITKIGKAALLTASMATYNFNISGTIRLNIPEGFRPSPSKKPTLYFYDGLPNAEMPFRGGYPYSWASDCSYIEFEVDGSDINNIANPSLGWELP